MHEMHVIHTSRGSRLRPRTRASAASPSNASGSRRNSPTPPKAGGSSTTRKQAPGGAGFRSKQKKHTQGQRMVGRSVCVSGCVCHPIYAGCRLHPTSGTCGRIRRSHTEQRLNQHRRHTHRSIALFLRHVSGLPSIVYIIYLVLLMRSACTTLHGASMTALPGEIKAAQFQYDLGL